MKLLALDGKLLRKFVLGGLENLGSNRGLINALNVFPVPDGDTGTNMLLTLQSAAKEIEQTPKLTLSAVAACLSKGSLMGARGNSGVILSQIFRGFAQSVGQYQTATAIQVAQAMQAGVETAYKAVMKPVEGTILTVVRECAREALTKAEITDNVVEVFQAALFAGEKALRLTPEQLPVLKKAGVVDAGGKGLLVILEGGINALSGDLEYNTFEPEQSRKTGFELAAANIIYRYCTEFLVSGYEISINKLQQELEELGDSLLAVGTEQVAKVHIHTNRPGLVLEISMEHGELHEININNMVDQHKEVNESLQTKVEKKQSNSQKIGVIAVADGSGLVKILESLGVDKIVPGGQTMNPSTEDLLDAVEQLAAENVVILPNNKNIILAANQAKDLCASKEIAIVPTKNFPQGLAALLAYDNKMEFGKMVENMKSNISNVKTGEITYAVRDSTLDGLEIKKGEILGIIDNQITCIGKEIEEVVFKVLGEMIKMDSELATLFFGENVYKEQAENLHKKIKQMFPDLEIEIHDGGQSIYYYIISVE